MSWKSHWISLGCCVGKVCKHAHVCTCKTNMTHFVKLKAGLLRSWSLFGSLFLRFPFVKSLTDSSGRTGTTRSACGWRVYPTVHSIQEGPEIVANKDILGADLGFAKFQFSKLGPGQQNVSIISATYIICYSIHQTKASSFSLPIPWKHHI